MSPELMSIGADWRFGDLMQNRTRSRNSLAIICSAALALGSTVAVAQHGGGGGGHFGGGGAHFAGGGHHAGGYHGGYGGYRGGYGWRGGYYGGWGWGLGGLGLGLYFATLPYYYSTYYWGGIPYYYSNDTYYTYDGNAGQYVTVAPPDGLASQVAAQPPAQASGGGTDLMAYPKNGQSEDQQKKDKYECHHWASTQSGFDPAQGSNAAGATANQRNDYLRAQTACLEGRGYSVK